jgi:ribosomal protein L11 methyltransferase
VIWKLAVDTAQEAEEAVTELLFSTFGQPVTSYTDIDTGRTRVTVFFEKKLKWNEPTRMHMRAGIERIRAAGLDLGTARISLRKVRTEDWAESWKRHFKPIEVGSELLIKPTWSKRRPRSGQSVVVLDPGLSFGTGQHPTTAFCLKQLVAHRDNRTSQSFLDIGTGSGILAIAAARLDYDPIHAFDLDPESVRTARANAGQNGVTNRIRFFQQDVAKLPDTRPTSARSGLQTNRSAAVLGQKGPAAARHCAVAVGNFGTPLDIPHAAAGPLHPPQPRSEQKYSVICANVLANVLLAERTRIVARLDTQGVLVLAGILKEEFGQIQQAYEACGLQLVTAKTEKDWRSASFMRH